MTRIGIIGARGYVGGELLRLLNGHPHFRATYVTSESQAGTPVAAAYPALVGSVALDFSAFDPAAAMEAADAFIFARPDGEAMRVVEPLLQAGKRVVDISGDFRVRDAANYQQWYRREHTSPHLLEEAVYGLPELHPEVREARLVANPGCHATGALLAVAPFIAAGVGLADGLLIDGKAGISGAGGRAGMQEEYSFPAISESVRGYGVTGHRHIAEMEQELERLAGGRAVARVSFTPHLIPASRGCYLTCYLPLAREATTAELKEVLTDFYRTAPFVHVTAGPPDLKHTLGSNHCLVHAVAEPRTRRAICFGAIDNLVKGAAGQAIQNLNLMLGVEETAGLQATALWP